MIISAFFPIYCNKNTPNFFFLCVGFISLSGGIKIQHISIVFDIENEWFISNGIIISLTLPLCVCGCVMIQHEWSQTLICVHSRNVWNGCETQTFICGFDQNRKRNCEHPHLIKYEYGNGVLQIQTKFKSIEILNGSSKSTTSSSSSSFKMLWPR